MVVKYPLHQTYKNSKDLTVNIKKTPSIAFYLHKAQKYRIPIFRILAKEYKITIFCDNAEEFENELNINYKKISLHKIGPFIFHNPLAILESFKYDAIVGLLNARCLDLMLLPIIPFRKCKIIYWGIGVTASYKKHFDKPDSSQWVRYLMARLSSAVIFYSEYPVDKYLNIGIKKEKIYVANNTVEVKSRTTKEYSNIKNKFLFIGTLYKEKGVEILLRHYLNAHKKIGDSLYELIIVGNGELLNNLKEFTKANNIEDKVKFLGAVYDDEKLDEIYSQAIACISPNQAGLSVLSSMARGTTFITSKNSITGGEILNIQSQINGILYDAHDELELILINASSDPEKYLKMGKQAYEYYANNRTPETMAKGIADAIKFSINK